MTVDIEKKVLEHDKDIATLKVKQANLECLLDNGIKDIKEDLKEIKEIFKEHKKKQGGINKDLYTKVNSVKDDAGKSLSPMLVVIITILVGFCCALLGALVTTVAGG